MNYKKQNDNQLNNNMKLNNKLQHLKKLSKNCKSKQKSIIIGNSRMKDQNHKIALKLLKKLKWNLKRNILNLWIRLLKIRKENLFRSQNKLPHQTISNYSKSLHFQQILVIQIKQCHKMIFPNILRINPTTCIS